MIQRVRVHMVLRKAVFKHVSVQIRESVEDISHSNHAPALLKPTKQLFSPRFQSALTFDFIFFC